MFESRSISVVVAAMLTSTAQATIVDGDCYLQGESPPLLCHTEVDCVTSNILPKETDCDGYYIWLVGPPPLQYHTFRYEHVGFWPKEQTEWIPIGGTTLDPVTLESKALCPMPDYPHCPPEWDYCFPDADGVHNPTSINRMEWWYVNFHLTDDETGREYAGFVSFHKPPIIGTPALELISVIDLDQGVQYSDAQLPLVFTASDQYADVVIGVDGRWYNRKCCGVLVPFEYHVHASGVDGGILWIDMDMRALKPQILVRGDVFV